MDEIFDLYEYNRWANDRVLNAVDPLTPEQFTRDLQNSFPSVRDTIVHIMSAEWIWLSRWLGTSPTGRPDDWDVSTLEAIRARWAQIEAQRGAFIATLTPESLATPVSYRNTQGEPFTNPLGHLLRHVVNHSTYHRGQVATMLRQLGVPPISTDLVLFYRQRTIAQSI
jgi:uncharacterized damage-inducible protein DinB